MSERRFVLVDFKHMNRVGSLRLYEAGQTYALSPAIAHAATKRELVAKQRPPGWVPPNMFQLPKVLTEAEVIEAEAELKALQRHALEVVDPEAESQIDARRPPGLRSAIQNPSVAPNSNIPRLQCLHDPR